jgi:LuxR family maltose regulon positive regulatory protein
VPAAAPVHLELGDLLRERHELDEAARHIARGIELCRQCQVLVEDLRNSYIYQARLKQARGDVAGALGVIRQAEPLARAYEAVPRFGNPIAACQARLVLAQASSAVGNVGSARLRAVERWAEARGLRMDGSIGVVDDEFEYTIWARLLIVKGEPERALQLLARLLVRAEAVGRRGHVIRVLALQALAHQACGDIDQALATLEQALGLAEPEDYVRTFVDEGAAMADLLRQVAARGIALNYVNRLLVAFEGTGSEPVTTLDPGLEPEALQLEPSIDSLTSREMEVLRLLRSELSGPEIAGELGVSANTVKTHVKRVYDKLGAHSRFEAVMRAQELGLI